MAGEDFSSILRQALAERGEDGPRARREVAREVRVAFERMMKADGPTLGRDEMRRIREAFEADIRDFLGSVRARRFALTRRPALAGSAAAIVLLAAALYFALTGGPADGEFVLFEAGRSAAGFQSAPGNRISDVDTGTGPAVAISSSLGGEPAADGTTGGAYLTIGGETEQAIEGRRVVIRILARAAPENGSDRFRAAYSTGGEATSGWVEFDVGPDFETHEFAYDVPRRAGGPDADYLGIWADPANSGRAIEVTAVTAIATGPRR